MAAKARISIFQQVIIILLFSLGTGLVVNMFRLTPLPLIGDWSHGSLRLRGETDIPIISLEDATVKFLSSETLFLDARSRADYQSGHIKGALHLPVHEGGFHLPVHEGGFGEMLQRFSLKVDRGRELIVYCDGVDCSLSPELASVLRGLGYRDVKILINGWTEWMMAGMPFEVE
jgi:rhodanese-related sulfurtransferase